MFQQSDSEVLPRFDLARAIEHVVDFSAAGIKVYSKEGKE
jgi:hypothetical protein